MPQTGTTGIIDELRTHGSWWAPISPQWTDAILSKLSELTDELAAGKKMPPRQASRQWNVFADGLRVDHEYKKSPQPMSNKLHEKLQLLAPINTYVSNSVAIH